MPAIRVGLGASVRSGVLLDDRINDDRFALDLAHGLAFVADASGPTYGAYYAPFAIDPGLAALTSTFLASGGSTHERLVAAVQEAHAVMTAMNRSYESQLAGRTGLVAARRAADAVRPQAWAGYDSQAHFGAP